MNDGPLVFKIDNALLLFVTDKYNVLPSVYATPGRAAAAAALAIGAKRDARVNGANASTPNEKGVPFH